MTFRELLAEVLDWLQQDGRISYRVLKRQFDLDDADLEDLKEGLLFAYPVVDEDGRGLVWTADTATPEPDGWRETEAELRFHALLPVVMTRLQREGRATYRTLKFIFGLDDTLLTEICEELTFRRLAIDEDGKGLIWTGETPPSVQPGEVAPSQNSTAATAPSPASPAPQPHMVATDATTNGPPASPVDASVEPLLGKQMSTPQIVYSAPEAERRQLTVMFCDLADSTQLSQQLDPEDLREVVRAYQSTAAEVIEQYEGHMAQYLGDGLLIYFGWPVAHEDDAQRAAHAGLGIVEAITTTLNPRLKAEKGVQLMVRLGIHTGPVVVGEMGGGGRHENLALGKTPNIAARLEGLAAPNTVVVSSVTSRLVQRAFVLEELGPHELKGVTEPMIISHVIGAVEQESTGPAMRGFGALVGRDEEIGLLLRRWQQAKEGIGQVVLLSGEAGIGKSSLVEGLRDHVRQEGLTRIAFRCSPYHTNSPLYPIITHMQHALDWQTHGTAEAKLAKLEQAVDHTNLSPAEAVPLLAELLLAPAPEERYAALSLTPQQQRQQTQDTLVAWLVNTAERQPVLAVWEDLHWADPSTLEVLGLFIDQTPTAPIMHMLTFRPEFEPPWPMRSYLTPITLNCLERAQGEELIAHLAGRKALPVEVVEHIIAKTDGVPLYVEELTKMLLDSELLREESEQYVLSGPLLTVSIPDTLQDSLMARLDRMQAAKEVAQLGAVLGREFSYEMLQAIAPLDESAVQTSLTELVKAELLYQRGRLPQATYIFKHALIRDAAYASLLKSTRQRAHHQIAEMFEAHFPDIVEAQPELVATHYTEAKWPEQASAYWRRAGERAMQRSDYSEAISDFEHALEALQALPDNPETCELGIDVRLALRTALIPAGDFQRIQTHLLEAATLAERLEDSRRLGQISVLLAVQYYASATYDQMIIHGQRAVEVGKAHGDIRLQAAANTYAGFAHYLRGDYQQSVDCLRWTTTSLTGELALEHLGQAVPPALHAHAFLAQNHAELGAFTEGIIWGEEALRIAEAVDSPVSVVSACRGIGLLYLRRGDLPAALPILERAVSICREMDSRTYFVTVASTLGAAYALSGRYGDAIPLLTQSIEQSVEIGALMFQSLRIAFLSEAYLLAGRLDDAGQCAQEALSLSRLHEERGYQAYIQRLLGDLAMHREAPDTDGAAALYLQAFDLATELGMRPLQAHCHRGLGVLYCQTGQLEPARTELTTAMEMYRDMDMTFWLPETEAALVELEGR